MYLFSEMTTRRLQKRTGSAAQLFSEKQIHAGQDILLARYVNHRAGAAKGVLQLVNAKQQTAAHETWKLHGYFALWRGFIQVVHPNGLVEVAQTHESRQPANKPVSVHQLPGMLESIEPEPLMHTLTFLGLAPKPYDQYEDQIRSKNTWLPLVLLDVQLLQAEASAA